jgi:hypothetical protein
MSLVNTVVSAYGVPIVVIEVACVIAPFVPHFIQTKCIIPSAVGESASDAHKTQHFGLIGCIVALVGEYGSKPLHFLTTNF